MLVDGLHYQFVGDVMWRSQNNDSSSTHLSLEQKAELLTMTSNDLCDHQAELYDHWQVK